LVGNTKSLFKLLFFSKKAAKKEKTQKSDEVFLYPKQGHQVTLLKQEKRVK
jgi:hypothetical protein